MIALGLENLLRCVDNKCIDSKFDGPDYCYRGGILEFHSGVIGPYAGPMGWNVYELFDGWNELNMWGPGNMFRDQYELDFGWALQERFDFSHGIPHLNYEFVNPAGSVQTDLNYLLQDNHLMYL